MSKASCHYISNIQTIPHVAICQTRNKYYRIYKQPHQQLYEEMVCPHYTPSWQLRAARSCQPLHTPPRQEHTLNWLTSQLSGLWQLPEVAEGHPPKSGVCNRGTGVWECSTRSPAHQHLSVEAGKPGRKRGRWGSTERVCHFSGYCSISAPEIRVYDRENVVTTVEPYLKQTYSRCFTADIILGDGVFF